APTPEAADALAAVRKHIANARSYRFWGGVPNGSQLAAQYEYHPGTSRPLRALPLDPAGHDAFGRAYRLSPARKPAWPAGSLRGDASGLAGVGQDLYDPAVYAAPASDPTLDT